MIRNLTLAVVLLVVCSCRDQGRPVVRARLPQDSIAYLCSNADLVALVEITTGIDWVEGKRPKGKIPTLVEARVMRVLKGSKKEGDKVTFSNVPAMLPPETARVELALYNGPHLVFLVKSGDRFDLMTDQSLIHETHGTVTPIWRRNPGSQLSHRAVPMKQAIADVVRALEEKESTEPEN